MDPPAMSSEELVLRNKRRRRLSDPSAGAKAEVRRRTQRKNQTLLKSKNGCPKENGHWGLLSNSLRSLQNRANQHLKLHNQFESLQAEAKEAIMNDGSCSCDVTESTCKTQQEQLAESFFDLAIWSSPDELMASLCYE